MSGKSSAQPSPARVRLMGGIALACGVSLIAFGVVLWSWLNGMVHNPPRGSKLAGSEVFIGRLFVFFASLAGFGSLTSLMGLGQIFTGRTSRFHLPLTLLGVAGVVICLLAVLKVTPAAP